MLVLVIVDCPSCKRLNRLPAARLREAARCSACKSQLVPLARSISIATPQEFDELVQDSPAPVLVDFWAPWCGPCRDVAPEVEAIARERAGSLIVGKVDTEDLPSVAGRFALRSVPTLILFRGGKETERVRGAMKASTITARLAL